MTKFKCKDCEQRFNASSDCIGAIYKEEKQGVKVDYFICKDCLDTKKHYHKLNNRSGWSHLYGDISSNDLEWMRMVTSRTLDTVCGEAGYTYLNT